MNPVSKPRGHMDPCSGFGFQRVIPERQASFSLHDVQNGWH